MLPTIQVFHKTIGMYGVMIAIGLIVGIAIMVQRSKRYSIQTEDALFASFFGGIGLFIGAKVLYLLISMPELARYYKVIVSHPTLLIPFMTGGFIFYGGLLGALLGIYLYCHRYKINFLQMLDLTAPSIPIIHAFGRVGCFFAGCCYGIPYSGFGHVIFQHSVSATNGIALFPTQLIESGINLVVGLFLLWYSRILRKPGRIIGIYITYYSILRYVMEFFRGDVDRGFFFHLSTSQWISLFLLPVGIWLCFSRKVKKQL